MITRSLFVIADHTLPANIEAAEVALNTSAAIVVPNAGKAAV